MAADSELSSWLALSLPACATPEVFFNGARALDFALAQMPQFSVPTLVFDVTALLMGGRLAPRAYSFERPLELALRQYDDEVLARLLGNVHWKDVRNAWSALPESERAAAAGFLAERVFAKMDSEPRATNQRLPVISKKEATVHPESIRGTLDDRSASPSTLRQSSGQASLGVNGQGDRFEGGERVAAGSGLKTNGIKQVESHSTTISHAGVRRLRTRIFGEVVQEGILHLMQSLQLQQSFADQLMMLAAGARRRDALLSDAEVFLMTHFRSLKSLAARVALAQLVEAASEIKRLLPRGIAVPPASTGEAATQVLDEGSFPAGGWSSFSTTGSFENLLPSELMYISEGGSPDLFDLRFAERELLYFARDESVVRRRRRQFCVVLGSSLTQTYVVDAGQPYQRLIWTLATLLVVTQTLLEGWSHEAAQLLWVFPEDAVLSPEKEVMQLLLGDWVAQGRLTFLNAAEAKAKVETQRRGENWVVLVGAPSALPANVIGNARNTLVLEVSENPVLRHIQRLAAHQSSEPGLVAWSEMARELVSVLNG